MPAKQATLVIDLLRLSRHKSLRITPPKEESPKQISPEEKPPEEESIPVKTRSQFITQVQEIYEIETKSLLTKYAHI